MQETVPMKLPEPFMFRYLNKEAFHAGYQHKETYFIYC
jgi:hypothetical protein